ncbi:MAG: outer membrane protein assembly factor BamB family protein, partial [Planctomycetota bacterium]
KILSDELFDLMLWQEGSYEFFEGFSLEDALAETGLDRIHGFTFDVGCLLLDAAYQADELRRSDSEYVCPSTILEKQDVADPESTEPKVTEFEVRLLHRMDGKRPRRDVCSVLPGNSLSHGRMTARFVANGWARPLLRTEAYNKGQVCVERCNHKQAVRYFEHALAASGDQPTDATLRVAIQAARAAISNSPVLYAALAINKAVRFVTNLPIVRVPVQALGRMESVARPARWVKDKWSHLRAVVSQTLNRWILAFEELMIQKGLAGQWWAVRTHVLTPVRRIGTALTTRFATATLASVAVLMILVVAGITDSGTERRKPALGGSSMSGFPPAEVKSAVAEVDAGGPFEVSPTVAGSAIYMASRDGTLRSMPLSNLGNKASFRWQVEIGKYGDLLSRPVVFGDKVFVTNVRGSVHAVSTAGKPLWTTKFPRVEKIAPSVIVATKPGLEPAGLVIVARDTVSVLDPENGEVLYQLRTGNMIIAPPAVNEDHIYVGGVDNHIYCADWRAGEIVWDTEVADDVMSLTLVGDHLVALIRGGTVIDLRAGDGEVSWQKDIVGSPVNRVEVLSGKRISLEMAQGELQICSLDDGKKLSSITPKAALGVTSLRAVGDKFIYVSRRGYIGQLSDKGAHLWCCETRLGQITGWTLLQNRLAMTNVVGELWFFDLSRQTSDRK